MAHVIDFGFVEYIIFNLIHRLIFDESDGRIYEISQFDVDWLMEHDLPAVMGLHRRGLPAWYSMRFNDRHGDQCSTAMYWAYKEACSWESPNGLEDWPLELEAFVKVTSRALFPLMVRAHNNEVRRAKKEYGRQINAELQEGGIDSRGINAYWRMQWRSECPPTAFIECVQDDNTPWHIVASAESWRVIEAAGADQIQTSVPRIVDLARAVCKARGERPASYKEVVYFLHNYSTASEDYEQPRLDDTVA